MTTVLSLNDYSTDPTQNTNIAGTNIGVGCPPQSVGIEMRTSMAFLAYAVQGTGGPIPATWNVSELIAASITCSGTATVGALVTTGGTAPGLQFGDLKYSALGIEGNGWRLCHGQTRPQTDPFWVYMIANGLTGGWLPGFSGSSTYNMPDARDMVLAGLDNMGGSSRGLLTSGVAGFDPTLLLNSGGNQHAQADTISLSRTGSIAATTTSTDSGHTHGETIGQGSGGNQEGSNLTTSTGTTHNLANVNTASGAANISSTTAITDSTSYTASSGLTGTSQNIQPTMVCAILLYVGA